jgi:hypothetical protein
LIITLFAFKVDSRVVHGFGNINCYIKHLKEVNKLDASYPEFAVANQTQNCVELIKINNGKVYQQISAKIRNELPFTESTDCILSEMKSQKSADDYMTRLVLSTSNTLTANEIQKKDQEIKLKIKATLRNATKSCKAFEKAHDKEFDSFFKIFSEGAADELKDYCVRKHVIDNKLLNTSIYNVTLNLNANATEISCAIILEKFAERFTKELMTTLKDDGKGLDELELECYLEKLHQSGFLNKLLVIGVLSQIGITEEQRKIERKNYVDFMNKASPYDCVL